MVNEEDHLRIQCILPGFQPMSALQMAESFDTTISSKLRYARTDNYGYLTSSLANIGTGLRISIMLHLAGLAYLEEDVGLLTAAAQLKTSVRGLFGEGTKAFGGLYQVSNETTMGFSTREIASRVRAVAEHLISREREARRKLASTKKEELADIVGEIRVRIGKARTLGGVEAMECISLLRLGAEAGLEDGLSAKAFNRLMVAVQLGASESAAGNLSSELKRARLVQEMLGMRGRQ
jgi:protein arginine kinase